MSKIADRILMQVMNSNEDFHPEEIYDDETNYELEEDEYEYEEEDDDYEDNYEDEKDGEYEKGYVDFEEGNQRKCDCGECHYCDGWEDALGDKAVQL